MSTLKELVANEHDFIKSLIESEGEVVEGMGEMQVKSDMLPAKVDNYHFRMIRLKNEQDYLKVRKKEIDQIIKRLKQAEDWLKDNMKNSMLNGGFNELKGNDRRFVLKKGRTKVSIDQNQLSAEFCKEEVVLSPDLDKIRDALEAGQDVAGARLEEVYVLNNYTNGGKK